MSQHHQAARTTPDVLEPLLQLHIAEYTALTTRNNNWVAIQVGIWTLIILYITAAVAAWTYFAQLKLDYSSYIVWGSGIVIQLAMAVLYFTVGEIYINVYYIQSKLRPILRNLVAGEPFWGYEEFLAKTSNRNVMDWTATAAVLAALIATALIRGAFTTRSEAKGLLINLPVAVFLVWRTSEIAKVRKKFQHTHSAH